MAFNDDLLFLVTLWVVELRWVVILRVLPGITHVTVITSRVTWAWRVWDGLTQLSRALMAVVSFTLFLGGFSSCSSPSWWWEFWEGADGRCKSSEVLSTNVIRCHFGSVGQSKSQSQIYRGRKWFHLLMEGVTKSSWEEAQTQGHMIFWGPFPRPSAYFYSDGWSWGRLCASYSSPKGVGGHFWTSAQPRGLDLAIGRNWPSRYLCSCCKH